MKSSRVFSLWLAALIALLAVFCSSCTKHSSREVIHLWHFWSEPNQQHTLDSLLRAFERLHPDIQVEATALQWSDGKAKLQTAFASGTAPDVVHLGLEWVGEFASASVLDTLPHALLQQSVPTLYNAVQWSGAVYALPWTMNCRALFIDQELVKRVASKTTAELTLDDIQSEPGSSSFAKTIGVNAYEPHNVLKKTVPFLWAGGSLIFQSLPLSASVDSQSVKALKNYVHFCEKGRMESSRQLDEALQRHELAIWPSGMWNLANRDLSNHYDVCDSWLHWKDSGDSSSWGWSILSADCWSITKNSRHTKTATLLLTYLSSSEVQSRFCASVPDAGFPVVPNLLDSSKITTDPPLVVQAILNRDPNVLHFYLQCLRSKPLASPEYFLEAEAIFEEQIMQALYAKKSAEAAMHDIQESWRQLEQRNASALRK